VGPRAVLDAVVSRKIPSPCLDSIIQPVAQYYTIELSRFLKILSMKRKISPYSWSKHRNAAKTIH
jgi:hypothetical protein